MFRLSLPRFAPAQGPLRYQPQFNVRRNLPSTEDLLMLIGGLGASLQALTWQPTFLQDQLLYLSLSFYVMYLAIQQSATICSQHYHLCFVFLHHHTLNVPAYL